MKLIHQKTAICSED